MYCSKRGLSFLESSSKFNDNRVIIHHHCILKEVPDQERMRSFSLALTDKRLKTVAYFSVTQLLIIVFFFPYLEVLVVKSNEYLMKIIL